jgi:hypothetical protein
MLQEPTKQEALEEMVAAVAYLATLVAKVRGNDEVIEAILMALGGDEMVEASKQRAADIARYRNAVSGEAVQESQRVTDLGKRPAKGPNP